jgi:hypothetical protein
MTEYKDAEYGFSFWHPSDWQIKQDRGQEKIFPGGRTVKTYSLTDTRGDWVTVWVVTTRDMKITDMGGAGPIGSITYSYDADKKKWMMEMPDNKSAGPTETQTRYHTMAGQPIFPGTSRFNTSIVPIADNTFVIVNDGGSGNAVYLAKTVVPAGSDVDGSRRNSTLVYFSNAVKPKTAR